MAWLLDQYANLVHYVTRQVYKFDTPLYDYDDLYSVGYLGLMDAAKKYDPSRGVKFSTFAVPRIRGAITDEIRRLNKASRGKNPPKMESIEGNRNENDKPIAELADRGLSPLDKTILKDQRLELMKTIARLTEMERQVIYLYYYKGYNMRKIADMIGRTEGRVSQVHSQAIKRLRNRLARFKSDLMN